MQPGVYAFFYFNFFCQNTKDSGVINKGKNYSDECGENNDCMTLLSLQVAMLMIMKPLPKLFTDVIKPWVFHCLWRCLVVGAWEFYISVARAVHWANCLSRHFQLLSFFLACAPCLNKNLSSPKEILRPFLTNNANHWYLCSISFKTTLQFIWMISFAKNCKLKNRVETGAKNALPN